jgi:replicative DNA helicase
MNRAAYTLAEIKETRKKRDELTYKIRKLEQEYYKLARRAALIDNANVRSGRLNPSELERLRLSASMIKNMSTANRTTKQWGLPVNLRNKIAKLMYIAGRT